MAHGCEDTPRYGLLGRTLGHTYSPRIYELLAGITGYERFEREPGEVEQFLREDAWQGLNVTIPYKRTVIPFLDELSESARRLGNANTIVRLQNVGAVAPARAYRQARARFRRARRRRYDLHGGSCRFRHGADCRGTHRRGDLRGSSALC